MLGWSRPRLASEAHVAERTVIDFERGARNPQASTVAAIRTALEAAGIEFTNGNTPGVRFHGK
jgi:transcriptional regulator with XRE-family HTH domain